MILATHGIVGSISGIDADWLAYYNRVIAAGGSLTTTEQNATKTLVADLKAYGIWSAMKAVYPMVGASAAACAQNLKSSSFTGTFTASGWTFASTGVTPNGTSAYMDTNMNAFSNLSLNSTHYSYYSKTDISANQIEMGVLISGNTPSYLLFSFSGVGYSAINGVEGARTSAANPTTGFLIGSRNSSTEEKYYTNNVSQTRTASSVSISNANIYIGAVNQNNNPTPLSTKECAFASIGDGLTDTQASNFYTAVQAFQTTLSRQV